jgi:hypothetical protein
MNAAVTGAVDLPCNIVWQTSNGDDQLRFRHKVPAYLDPPLFASTPSQIFPVVASQQPPSVMRIGNKATGRAVAALTLGLAMHQVSESL